MSKESRIIKNYFSQQGYADLMGLNKSSVSMQCRLTELGDGDLDIYYTEDGKRLIKVDPDLVKKLKK